MLNPRYTPKKPLLPLLPLHFKVLLLNSRGGITNFGNYQISSNITSMTSVRIDKWLWAARFFKTRSLASRACDLGRIFANDQQAKPAREVRVGDMLRIRTEGDAVFTVEVLQLSVTRGPASVARTLYRETDAGRELRLKAAAERKAMMDFAPSPQGRPSKRDRRRIIQFRGRE